MIVLCDYVPGRVCVCLCAWVWWSQLWSCRVLCLLRALAAIWKGLLPQCVRPFFCSHGVWNSPLCVCVCYLRKSLCLCALSSKSWMNFRPTQDKHDNGGGLFSPYFFITTSTTSRCARECVCHFLLFACLLSFAWYIRVFALSQERLPQLMFFFS